MNSAPSRLDPPPYLSPSSIDTFKTCPLQYKLSRIDKLDEQSTEPQVLGNFVHDVLEELMKLDPTRRTMTEAKKFLTSLFNDRWQEAAAEVAKDLKAFKWKAYFCVENYFLMEDPTDITPGGLETPLLLDPNDPDSFVKIAGVPIKGFIDRWDDHGGVVSIVDYKTGKFPSATRFQEPKFQQLTIYADAISQITGKPVDRMTLMFVKDGKAIWRPVTEARLEQMRETVRETYDLVLEYCELGEFPATPNTLCNWCSFKGICPAWN